MRFRQVLILLAFASSEVAVAQTMVCPAPGGRACDLYHFHVQLYRPDTHAFVELSGINDFASQAACERARDARTMRNTAVVEQMKRSGEAQYPADRFGPCHCDMTFERDSPTFLTDAQRMAQLRLAEEIRQRVRERLIDAGATADSEVVRGLMPQPLPTTALAGPKLVSPPGRVAASTTGNAISDLKMTKAADASAAGGTNLDLPLVEIGGPTPPVPAEVAVAPAPAPVPVTTPTPTPTPAPPAPPAPGTITITNSGAGTPLITNVPIAPAPSPAPAPAPAPPPAPMPTINVMSPEDAASADDAAESFVSYETQRIQNVLRASTAITDESLKAKIFESSMQRIQLLSNLRSLIQGSGAHSKLALAARAAKTEDERMAFAARLFGTDMPTHWAARDAADVVLDARPELETDTEKVLRDPVHFNEQQRKRAFYLLLAKTQPSEETMLWLGEVAEGFLQ